MAGCIAWTLDGLLQARLHAVQHAILAFLLAILFGAAWAFYRSQPS